MNIFNITRTGNRAANFWEDVRQPTVLVLWTDWGKYPARVLSEKYLDTSPVPSQNKESVYIPVLPNECKQYCTGTGPGGTWVSIYVSVKLYILIFDQFSSVSWEALG